MTEPSPLFSNPFNISPEAEAECAREPIHVPGHVQAPGVVLACDFPRGSVLRASGNSASLLGAAPDALFGRTLSDLFGPSAASLTALTAAPDGVPQWVVLTPGSGPPLHGLAHRNGDLGFVELLPADWPDPDEDVDRRVRDLVLRLGTAGTVLDYCRTAVGLLRELTGFDRVLAYRFDEHGHGEVIAEDTADGDPAYLGMWFPRSDIPDNARRILRLVRVQALSDVYYQAVPLVGPGGGVETPVDLTYCLFRSVSPMCRGFYHNMGVRATLVIAVARGDDLWGLFACHHRSGPRPCGPRLLSACRFLSEFLSLQLSGLEARERLAAGSQAHRLAAELGRALAESEPGDWPRALAGRGEELLALVGADGAAVARGRELTRIGRTPEAATIRRLAEAVHTRTHEGVFASATLPHDFPGLAMHLGPARGLLFIRLSWQEDSFVAWFRQEQGEVIRWAGVPAKPVVREAGRDRLHPRRSFEEFACQVRDTSRSWGSAELAAADLFRSSLLAVVLEAVALKRAVAELDLLRVRRVLEASSEAAAVFSPGGAALLVNSAFTRLLGRRAEDLAGPGTLAGLFADPAAGAAAADAVVGGGEWSGECDLAGPGGPVPAAVRIDTVTDEAGRPAGHIGLFIDLTNERRMQEQIRQAQKLESLGVMAGGVAHDFNNLMTGVLGHASLASVILPPGSPAADSIRQIETAARRAAELCQQMLAFAGRGRIAVGPVDLNALVREMGPLLTTIVSKSVRLHLDLGDVPPVRGDATQLRQVLMNLILNGAESIGPGGGVVTVRTILAELGVGELEAFPLTTGLAAGRYVRLEVADSGCGMDAETAARIFDPFFSTKFLGRGLGLAAVLGIVRGHKGAIRVETRPGAGSTFTVLLPLVDAPAAVSPTPAGGAGAGRLILVVDDEPSVSRVARAALERAGFRVVEAADGDAGLAEFTRRPDEISLVVLDLTMPGKSGLEVLGRLRELRPGIPVVLSSGYSAEDLGPAGADRAGFLPKPYRANDLLRAVHQALGD
jgi:light-regulated signal transduction histidine kinase (bacteriophytochrome)